MDVYACATMMLVAGLAAAPIDEPADERTEAATLAAAPSASERAPVSFRFLTREEGHEILLTDVHVRIVHPVHGTLLEAVSNGPFLVAYVPVGRYDVAASHEGRTQHLTLTVARPEPRNLALYW
jgi:hypothetical protein